MADLEVYLRLDAQLTHLLNDFTSLLKAARLTDEIAPKEALAGPGREKRASGALIEVLAEKTVTSGTCTGTAHAIRCRMLRFWHLMACYALICV